MQILQLEKHLKDQQVVRGALEKALGPNAAQVNLSPENPVPKVTIFHPGTIVSLLLSQLFITHQVNRIVFFRQLMN
jgi:hypothetical protein